MGWLQRLLGRDPGTVSDPAAETAETRAREEAARRPAEADELEEQAHEVRDDNPLRGGKPPGTG